MRFVHRWVVLLIASTSTLPAVAEEALAAQPVRRNHFSFVLTASRWDDAGGLELAPLDYTLQQSGRFASDGFGAAVSFHRRLARSRTPAVLLGADFGGHSHNNERAAIWTNAGTGEQTSVRLSLSWGYVTGSARLVWREARMPEVVVGVGAGLCMLRMQEQLEGFGYAETGTDDTSWGGFLSAGLRFPVRSGRLRIVTDLKAHAFSFANLGSAFPGQQAAGPAYTFELGVDWMF